jgi:hypothetical protein
MLIKCTFFLREYACLYWIKCADYFRKISYVFLYESPAIKKSDEFFNCKKDDTLGCLELD